MYRHGLVGKCSALGSTACEAIGSLKSIGLAAFMKSLFPQLGIRIYLLFFPVRASSRQPSFELRRYRPEYLGVETGLLWARRGPIQMTACRQVA